MSKKNLKKQVFAAVAMVMVSGLALGSSTYAWFVSNSNVTANTTAISAQSNSAYLVIDVAETTTASTYEATIDNALSVGGDAKLYPVEWANNFAAGGVAIDGEHPATWQFESAYALTKDAADINSATRFLVGTPTQAEAKDYALSHTFYVGTGTYDGEFTELKVSDMAVSDDSALGLKGAMRVLVEAYDSNDPGTLKGWVVAKVVNGNMEIESQSDSDGIVYADQFGKAEGDVIVKIYEFYDGDDANVKTTNLEQLTGCSATVTFTATPIEHK